MARHLTVLGILWVVLSAMRLFRGGGHLAGAPVLAGFGNRWIHHFGGDWPVGDFLAHILFVSGAVLVVLAALGFEAGWGLLVGDHLKSSFSELSPEDGNIIGAESAIIRQSSAIGLFSRSGA